MLLIVASKIRSLGQIWFHIMTSQIENDSKNSIISNTNTITPTNTPKEIAQPFSECFPVFLFMVGLYTPPFTKIKFHAYPLPITQTINHIKKCGMVVQR